MLTTRGILLICLLNGGEGGELYLFGCKKETILNLLYSRDYKGLGVVHEKTPPKIQPADDNEAVLVR